jgi:hypothetical protein
MAVIGLYMTMSVNGYIAGLRDSVGAPMGIGGFRLSSWRADDPGPDNQVFTELMATRAAVIHCQEGRPGSGSAAREARRRVGPGACSAATDWTRTIAT